MRTPTVTPTPGSQASTAEEGAQQHNRGSQVPRATETDVGSGLEPVVAVGRTGKGDSCYVPVTVEGVACLALVDSGSTVTLVRPDMVPDKTVLDPTSVRLRTVTGELAPMEGSARLTISVGGVTVYHLVWVATVQDPCILGLDLLKAAGCQLDFQQNTVSFQGGPYIKMSPTRVPTLPPAVPSASAAEAEPEDPPVPAESGVTSSAADPTVQEEDEELLAAIKALWDKNRDGLHPRQQEQLWQTLWEFRGIFARNEEEVGQTHLAVHVIDTGDARPIKCRPRRLPLARQNACDEAVAGMLQAGIIEPSDSPWAAAVVMVPKKTRGWRLCADYRPVNGVTRKDSYPLPRIDESLDLVSGSSWFSSLDLRSGYYQVPLAPESRPKTAFCTGRGLWQFKVLSFGLCNAPATFVRLMDKVLEGVPRQQCLVYLDDILAHGDSFESALASLRLVLGRIKSAGLKLHPEKCHFLQREVSFLGHRVGAEGVGTLQEKVQAVADWPTPTNPKQLKSFLGLSSYYRRFVRGFGGTAAPLFQLLQKDREFSWTEECQAAFNSLRGALIEAPVLATADPNLPFTLDTDASGGGVGGVLSQPRPEGERVVAYFSRSFSKAERRYCVTRRELLAVVLSIRHFKYYLCGRPFTVRTDHAALQWLMSFKEPEGQVARWLEELQSFEFVVEHRAGARHTNADALSRRPCAIDECRYCERRESREQVLREEEGDCAAVRRLEEVAERERQPVDLAEWKRQLSQDTDLQAAVQWVEAEQRPPWEEVAGCSKSLKGLWSQFESLRLSLGVLQRAWKEPATGEAKWQMVVPKGLRVAVLESMHGAAGSGHFGVSKTLRRLRRGFYWGQCRRDVEDFCRRCDLCTARKGPPGRSHAALQQSLVGAPMERVAVDVVGPLPRSDGGNRFVLTAIDYFTKWPEAYAIPDQEAETVVEALVGGMFSRFGIPENIHSDQGRNFESRVFASMCERLGMHKTRTSPLRPQSDGLVERFHRTMGQQLAILTSQHQRDWDKHLPLVLMACRSAVQESSACTPALLMLGRELRTPGEMAFGRPPEAPDIPPGPEFARRLQDRLESAHEFSRGQQLNAGVRQKRNYDVRERGQHFRAGELVWVYNPQRKKGRCPKLDSQWAGPCRVLERVGEVVYRVQLPPKGRRVVLHRDRLAPYRGTASPLGSGAGGHSPQRASSVQPPESLGGGAPAESEVAVPVAAAPGDTTPQPGRARRQRRAPVALRDFVVQW